MAVTAACIKRTCHLLHFMVCSIRMGNQKLQHCKWFVKLMACRGLSLFHEWNSSVSEVSQSSSLKKCCINPAWYFKCFTSILKVEFTDNQISDKAQAQTQGILQSQTWTMQHTLRHERTADTCVNNYFLSKWHPQHVFCTIYNLHLLQSQWH